MPHERKVDIWTVEEVSDEKSALPTLGKRAVKTVSAKITDISKNLKEVILDFQTILEQIPKSPTGYYVDEFEISFGVNANGGIALLGSLEAGVQGSIKVKIKRDKT